MNYANLPVQTEIRSFLALKMKGLIKFEYL